MCNNEEAKTEYERVRKEMRGVCEKNTPLDEMLPVSQISEKMFGSGLSQS